ncbi:DUF2946 family protein [Rhodobacter sp. Har01]|uniref:DUF2946 family protein n=1 Tax=Rhodobacter sp. Har01 TaxID=2883999 RepID=UPI001D06BD80|nr:DUF2946 family protein [Rhodobacter sp. Har01]MCB6178253.1 DUF2946 family protein [Rhodobacter sp. Har01]
MRLIHALRLLLVLAVALAVALVSGQTAIGRAEARGAVLVEICADGGTAVVSLDAEGKPAVHRHACPDCVLGGLALASALPMPLLLPRQLRARLGRPVSAPAPRLRRRLRVRSRGPPAAA